MSLYNESHYKLALLPEKTEETIQNSETFYSRYICENANTYEEDIIVNLVTL
jgi:hypothetical protein